MGVFDFFASLLSRETPDGNKADAAEAAPRLPRRDRQATRVPRRHQAAPRPPVPAVPAVPPGSGSSPEHQIAHGQTELAGPPMPRPSDDASAAASDALGGPFDVSADSLTDDGVDDLTDDILSAFDQPVADFEGPSRGGDIDDARDLFTQIASTYFRPVKNFMFELRCGTATKQWLDICTPVLESIVEGARSMDLEPIAVRMVDFREALDLARNTPGSGFDEAGRDLIVTAYNDLMEILPAAFATGEEDQRRESIIIHSLLQQVTDVGTVTIEKIYRAGLTSLSTLFMANAGDLAATTGVPLWLSERICERITAYRHRLEEGSPEDAEKQQRQLLKQAVDDLRQHQHSLQEITESEDSSRAEEKREHLRQRQAAALRVQVLLAEMGEVALVDQLRKLAIERRIEEIDRYINSASGSTPPLSPSQSTGQFAAQEPATG